MVIKIVEIAYIALNNDIIFGAVTKKRKSNERYVIRALKKRENVI